MLVFLDFKGLELFFKKTRKFAQFVKLGKKGTNYYQVYALKKVY